MPCFDPRDREDLAHNNEAAALLCTLLKRLLAEGYDMRSLPDELNDWWREHTVRDIKRKAGLRYA